MNFHCRKAAATDTRELFLLIEGYAQKGIMLPRSEQSIAKMIDSFTVAESDGRIVGCGSLFQLGAELVEIRSLGILDAYKGQGIGSCLVEFLEAQARSQNIPKIMALTYEVRFFERNGFQVVSKEIFPEKVWTDCVHCKKQHCCDEIAVLKKLD